MTSRADMCERRIGLSEAIESVKLGFRYIIDTASRLSDLADDGLLLKAVWIVVGYFSAMTLLGVAHYESHDELVSSIGVFMLIAGTSPVICLVMVAGVMPCLLLYRRQSSIQYEEAYWELPSYRRLGYALGMFVKRYYVNEMRFHGLGNIIYSKWKDSVEEVAIVGENGSGKSTFAALLTGLFTPQKGRVLFNGRDIARDIAACLWNARKSISCIFQEYGKFELPAKEFIRRRVAETAASACIDKRVH